MHQFEFTIDYDDGILYMSHASQDDIDTFPFQDYKDATVLYLFGDYFHTFQIPYGITNATIVSKALRKLYVPDSIEYLNVCDNCLTELELPGNIEMLRASNCYLMQIKFRSPPTKLGSLIINRNRLASLDFEAPPSLEYIDVRKNNGTIHMHSSILKIHNAMLPDEYEEF